LQYGGALHDGLVWLHARASIRAHTNTQYLARAAFPRQQSVRERASMLRYTYIATPVPHHLIHGKLKKSY
jgi:hypothetical protein